MTVVYDEDCNPPPMTVQEVALVRALVHWRRESEATFFRRVWTARGRFGEICPGGPSAYWHGASVAYDKPTSAVGWCPENFATGSYRWLPHLTVTEAVDVLAVLGFLPARFSSAYRAGHAVGATAGVLAMEQAFEAHVEEIARAVIEA